MWCRFQDGTWAAEEAEKLCDTLLVPLHAHFLRISKPQVSAFPLQGYLAHKKQRPPFTLQ